MAIPPLLELLNSEIDIFVIDLLLNIATPKLDFKKEKKMFIRFVKINKIKNKDSKKIHL